jgi:hypothetical protein
MSIAASGLIVAGLSFRGGRFFPEKSLAVVKGAINADVRFLMATESGTRNTVPGASVVVIVGQDGSRRPM